MRYDRQPYEILRPPAREWYQPELPTLEPTPKEELRSIDARMNQVAQAHNEIHFIYSVLVNERIRRQNEVWIHGDER